MPGTSGLILEQSTNFMKTEFVYKDKSAENC